MFWKSSKALFHFSGEVSQVSDIGSVLICLQASLMTMYSIGDSARRKSGMVIGPYVYSVRMRMGIATLTFNAKMVSKTGYFKTVQIVSGASLMVFLSLVVAEALDMRSFSLIDVG